jgi:hypothetical protein
VLGRDIARARATNTSRECKEAAIRKQYSIFRAKRRFYRWLREFTYAANDAREVKRLIVARAVSRKTVEKSLLRVVLGTSDGDEFARKGYLLAGRIIGASGSPDWARERLTLHRVHRGRCGALPY